MACEREFLVLEQYLDDDDDEGPSQGTTIRTMMAIVFWGRSNL